MSIPLRVLIIEDSPDDAEMIVLHLTDAGLQPEWRRVQTESDYLAALETNPDLILADWSLPQFSGLRALQWVKERQLDIPFIIVSATIGEDRAVEAMKQGAVDYLLKDRLARLPEAVAQALEKKRLRDENRRAEAMLRESEARYRTIYEGVQDSIFVESPTGEILDVNQRACELFGYSRAEFLTKNVIDLVPPGSLAVIADENLIDSLPDHPIEALNMRANGEIFPVELSCRLQEISGKPALLVVLRDITERKQAEQALRTAEKKYRSIFDNSVEGIYQSTLQGCYLTANKSLAQMLGYNSPAELIADATDLDPQFYVDPNRRQEFMRELEEQETISGFESQIYRKDGSVIWVTENARAVRDENGNLLYYEGTTLDITERKCSEDQIKASLAEKEVLLREIHHRVKNNLAIVSSLLEMQARRSHNEQVRNEFQVSQQRIQAMAQIHEQLYRSQNLARIDMADYVTALTNGLRAMDILSDVVMKVEVRDVILDIDQAVPCGLIINELLTNALKYAFSTRRRAGDLAKGQSKEILVSMQPENESYVLKVSDNGAGLPAELDVKNTKTLGLRLVNRLTGQLEGDLQVASEPGSGTTISITFPVTGGT